MKNLLIVIIVDEALVVIHTGRMLYAVRRMSGEKKRY